MTYEKRNKPDLIPITADNTNSSIIIYDQSSYKFVNFAFQRWAKLQHISHEIDTAIETVLENSVDVFYQRHIGATWFVTIQSGDPHVDIRKHFNYTPLQPTLQQTGDSRLLSRELLLHVKMLMHW